MTFQRKEPSFTCLHRIRRLLFHLNLFQVIQRLFPAAPVHLHVLHPQHHPPLRGDASTELQPLQRDVHAEGAARERQRAHLRHPGEIRREAFGLAKLPGDLR